MRSTATRAIVKWLAVATAVIVLLAACSGDDDSSGSGASKSSNATGFTSAQLQDLLVPASDVPAAYRKGKQANATGAGTDAATKVCGSSAIPESVPQQAQAEVTYIGGAVGPALAEVLLAYDSAQQAAAVYHDAQQAFVKCPSFDVKGDKGAVTHYKVAAMSLDKVADEQAAYVMTIDTQGAGGDLNVFLTHRGSLVVLTIGVSLTSIFGNGSLKPGEFLHFSKTAYTRVKDAG